MNEASSKLTRSRRSSTKPASKKTATTIACTLSGACDLSPSRRSRSHCPSGLIAPPTTLWNE
eukprot:scaffold124251_cov36-Tisochrysis_lutea.AAC.4